MWYRGILGLATMAWLIGGIAQAAPLEAYGSLPTLELVTLSPDGSKIAYIGSAGGERYAIFQDLTGKVLASAKVGDQKVRGMLWADETHVLVTTSLTSTAIGIMGPREEYAETVVFNIDDHTQRNLMARVDDMAMNTIAEMPQRFIVDGKPEIRVEGVYFPEDRGVLALYAVDPDTMHTVRVRTGTITTQNFIVDSGGNLIAQQDYDESKRHWSLRLHVGGDWKEVYGEDAAIDTPEILGVSGDGASLFVESRKTGEAKMLAFSLTDGSVVPPTLSYLAEPIEDPVTHRIIGERWVGHDVIYRFFDVKDREAWTKAVAHFPGEVVEFESMSDNHSRFVVHVTGNSHGDEYELVDASNDTVIPIGPVSKDITNTEMSRVTQFVYATSDGLQIDAYLTLPSGRDPHNLALIVMPHGGPAARDEPGFDWWAQAMAAQGYAVLQPQFRGSAGFSWELMAAGFGQWGRKMQTDLSDGVRAVVRAGIADPKRVCIVGASYGGYAAVAGATLDPDVYRCAVAVGAVTDPASFIAWRDSRERRTDTLQERYWSRYMGASGPDDPVLDTISPVKQAARDTIPILLIHGKDDTVVPLSQSEDMADALKKAGKSYDIVVLDGEDHWLSRSKTRNEMLKVSTEFLLKQNPP